MFPEMQEESCQKSQNIRYFIEIFKVKQCITGKKLYPNWITKQQQWAVYIFLNFQCKYSS